MQIMQLYEMPLTENGDVVVLVKENELFKKRTGFEM